jgi:hypothetical protein
MSPRLTEAGQAAWQSLLEEAMQSGNDDWLAHAIVHRGFIRSREHTPATASRDGAMSIESRPPNNWLKVNSTGMISVDCASGLKPQGKTR